MLNTLLQTFTTYLKHFLVLVVSQTMEATLIKVSCFLERFTEHFLVRKRESIEPLK